MTSGLMVFQIFLTLQYKDSIVNTIVGLALADNERASCDE
jgi:hypothetical protein